jgi:hypothetical protein
MVFEHFSHEKYSPFQYGRIHRGMGITDIDTHLFKEYVKETLRSNSAKCYTNGYFE